MGDREDESDFERFLMDADVPEWQRAFSLKVAEMIRRGEKPRFVLHPRGYWSIAREVSVMGDRARPIS